MAQMMASLVETTVQREIELGDDADDSNKCCETRVDWMDGWMSVKIRVPG